jgi:23S rRNA G2445 N2-methylase RlmL
MPRPMDSSMANAERMDPKEHYKQLRKLPLERLWSVEVAGFNSARGAERGALVGVIRAVGTVFSERGSTQQQAEARRWLRSLLEDPEEKVRRYALQALPKLGAGALDESDVLDLLHSSKSEREKKKVAETLSKIGGKGTLQMLEELDSSTTKAVEQRVRATVARRQSASTVLTEAALPEGKHTLHLRCRTGLETILEDEIQQSTTIQKYLTLDRTHRGLISVSALPGCSLSHVLGLRTFSELSFLLGSTKVGALDAVADLISSGSSHALLSQLTEGPLRYRMELGESLSKAQLTQITDRVFQQRPELLNDSRQAPWQIHVQQQGQRWLVELSPRLRPDPRFAYRVHDVPASSHPPLAAAMARLAQITTGDVVWDPFCGSGLELIESAKLGKVRCLYGTDLNGNAIVITRTNLKAAKLQDVPQKLHCTDFRNFQQVTGLGQGSLSVIISNPPLGKRVPIPELRALMMDLLTLGSQLLGPGGRMVLINPIPDLPIPHNLRRSFKEKVDLGGFEGTLEKYQRVAPR